MNVPRLRKSLWLGGAGLGLVAGFAWGFLSHRNRAFPFAMLRAAAVVAGLAEPALPPLVETRSKEVEPPPPPDWDVLWSVPYVDALPASRPEERGVVIYDAERSFPGVNFYSMTRRTVARLVDMAGKILHEWSLPTGGRGTWHHAELLGNGDLLVTLQDASVVRIDRWSRRIWAYPARAHHDLWVDEGGDIYFLSREAVTIPEIHPHKKITDDRLVVLTGDGKLKEEFSLLDVFRNSPYAFLLTSVRPTALPERITELDLFHANHVEVFDGRLEARSPLFRRGNILVSLKNINSIAILEAGTRRIVWLWGPNNVILQHHPRLLDNGHILLFDNGTRFSRILELDPLSRLVVWSYESRDEFFSFWGGANQRLPNGNTLVTETAKGYAFEVTPEGQVVWKFANPEVDGKGLRWNLWRMTRYRPEELPFLEAVGP